MEGRSPLTIRDYKDELNAFLTFVDLGYPKDVKSSHIIAYITHLQDLGRASSTVNRAFGNLRNFFNWLVEEKAIKVSPCASLKAPKEKKYVKPVMSRQQFNYIISLCPPNRLTGVRRAAMLTVLITSGIRLAELSGIQPSDIFWDQNRIKVLGKGNKERVVPFRLEAKKAMWRYTRMKEEMYPELDEYLWVSRYGPMRYQGVQQDLARMYRRAGFSEVLKDAVHGYRRAWAMWSLMDGVDVINVQVAGGWEDLGVLTKHYLPSLNSEKALAAFERLDQKGGK